MLGWKPMKVLIYEPEHRGHHMADLSRVIPAVLRVADEVVWATTPEALKSSEFAATIGDIPEGLRVEACCREDRRSVFRFHLHSLLECSKLARRFGADHVYLMMGDGKWQIAEVFGLLGWRPFRKGVTSDTYLIRGNFAYPEATSLTSRVKRFLFRRMLRRGSFTSVLMLDEILADRAKGWARPEDRGRAVLSPAPMVPLPGLEMSDARQKLGLPPGGQLLLMLGMIQPLRGADRVLRAYVGYRRLTSAPPAKLVLAGPHDPAVVELLSEEPFASLVAAGEIVCQDEYLNNDQMFAFAAACDVMTVGTHRHGGRSSALVWAAANGRPVVTTDTGSIGWVVESSALGLTCDVTDSAAYSIRLLEVLDASYQFDSENAKRYAAFHHIDNYCEIATACIRRKLQAEGGGKRGQHRTPPS